MSKKNIVWIVLIFHGIAILSCWFFFGSESATTETFQKNGNVGEVVEGAELLQTITNETETGSVIDEIGLFLAT